MGNGRKKRSSQAGNSALHPATSSSQNGEGSSAEHSQQEQVKPSCDTEKTSSRLNAYAAPFKNKATLDAESSSFFVPKKSSSVPVCRYFQRGYCRYGESCRFQHLGAASASAKPFTKTASDKSPVKESCIPEECLDWHLTGICPRSRTCRYAHPFDCKNMQSGAHQDPTKGNAAFEYMASEFLWHGLHGGRGGSDGTRMGQRMGYGGFTEDDIYELSLQGIKPWDPEARDALGVLKGWDVDYDDYDYDDDYDELGRRMSGFGF